MLAAVLAAAAFAAGMTGAWSPCGFSIVETVGAATRRRTLAASCAALTLGAVAGGVATFGGLALLGLLVPGSRAELALPAAALAALAAVAEARGVRIVPQIRRQVPEPWRRRLPLALAAAAYGALLGLGFATFVLTLAFWVLVAIAFALGDPAIGLAVGVAFGVGRAVPIVALAPVAGRPLGRRAIDAMAMRPRLLRTFRLANAVALTASAAAIVATPGRAATLVAVGASDPSTAGAAIAWEAHGRGFLRLPKPREPADAHHLGALAAPLPGSDPALGGSLLAWREGDVVRVVSASDFMPVAELTVPGVDALAVNDAWLAYRTRRDGRDRIAVRHLPDGSERTVAAAGPFSALGRPALGGNLLVFHLATSRDSRIVAVDLRGGPARVVRRSGLQQLTNPAVRGGDLLYVRQSDLAQELVVGPLARPRRDRVLYRTGPAAARDRGYEAGHSHVTRTPRPRRSSSMLWTTALAPGAAYLTLVPIRGGEPRIVRVGR